MTGRHGGPYPAAGVCEQLASTGQFPPLMRQRLAGRAPVGLVVSAAGAILLAVGFGLGAIASIGSAAALLVFLLATLAHVRVRGETGARTWLLVLALASTGIAFLGFLVTTLATEPASVWTLLIIILVSVMLDFWWTRTAEARADRRAPDPRRKG
jgi:amino acid transporter